MWNFIDGLLLAVVLDAIGAAGIIALVHFGKAPCLCRLVGHKHICGCDD